MAKTVIVAILVAGPAIRNTRAAPGEIPFIRSIAAIGTDAVAQIYRGTEAKSIRNIPAISLVIYSEKKLSGIRYEIKAAIISPIINHLAIS